ncbi:siderophore-interacting protein [Actinoplanes sp. N902-109]|uniref:siderophore-interacting protein n=1 Tax=Actinoplanes sp. (strain N902-109) TaxID=649831 RepID=UPI00032961B5|nr:siderophore-interacting protein [Actinoplanes sp. N902-109]AGL17060.1 siderophore-interacting protein [Actinoplanes sp. N902-109]
MAKKSRTTPTDQRLYRVEVRRARRITPHMQRVTVGGESLAGFPWLGYDHWFRLFVRRPHQTGFAMPEISGEKWWVRYLECAEDTRPHCANYTIADFRAEQRELDIDFVVHTGPDGEPEGPAALWACATTPGEQLAVLDQGILFAPPADTTEVTIVADESGLPGVTGILRSLPAGTVGRVIQEVPTAADRRELTTPPGVTVHWVDREDHGAVPGHKALAALRDFDAFDPRGYGFVVGESSLATEGRRHLHRGGLPKDRITFSGFWKR